MTILAYSNNVSTTLQSPVTSTATTLVLATGTGAQFPTTGTNQGFYLTILDAATQLTSEICLCTNRSVDTLTVQRAQQGTTALSWAAGSIVSQLVTAGDMSNFIQIDQLQSATYFTASAGGSANSLTATLPSDLTAIPDGMTFIVEASAANTGAATLTLSLGSNTQPAHAIVKYGQAPLVANDIPAAHYPISLTYSAAWTAFVMNNPATSVASAVAGGGANELLVQTATSTTGFVPAPTTAGQVLEWNGSSIGWQAVTSAVSSFNGRTGAVVPQSGDYTAAEVGAAALSQFTAFLSQNGYQFLPGGLLLQWGVANAVNGSSPTTVTFPYQFPNACFIVTGTAIIPGTGATPDTVLTMDQYASNYGFSARLGGQGGSSFWLNGPFYWFAIGN
jgi:hypothetical protein